jgi:hypothetical protein
MPDIPNYWLLPDSNLTRKYQIWRCCSYGIYNIKVLWSRCTGRGIDSQLGQARCTHFVTAKRSTYRHRSLANLYKCWSSKPTSMGSDFHTCRSARLIRTKYLTLLQSRAFNGHMQKRQSVKVLCFWRLHHVQEVVMKPLGTCGMHSVLPKR